MSNTSAAKKANGESKASQMEVKRPEPKVENTILSLEKRIQKVSELNIVIEKWRKLQEAKQNLNEFKLGNDGLSSTIIIRDAAGREFKTSQNIVFTTVMASVQKVIHEKITETEEQINFAV